VSAGAFGFLGLRVGDRFSFALEGQIAGSVVAADFDAGRLPASVRVVLSPREALTVPYLLKVLRAPHETSTIGSTDMAEGSDP